MAGSWYRAIGARCVEVACDGASHRVSWRRGRLVVHDHDVAAELVMMTMGGRPPDCIALLFEWRDSAWWVDAMRPQPAGFVRRRPPPVAPEAVAQIRRLGVVRSWERTWQRAKSAAEADDLFRILHRRALPGASAALEQARRIFGGGPVSYVEIHLAPPDSTPTVEGAIDPRRSSLVIHLPPDWLYRVEHAVPAGVGEGGAFVVAPGHRIAWHDRGDGRFEATIEPAFPAGAEAQPS